MQRTARPVRLRRLDRIYGIHSRSDLTEDGVLAVEPRRRVFGDDEELRAVGARVGVRHLPGRRPGTKAVDCPLREAIRGPSKTHRSMSTTSSRSSFFTAVAIGKV